MTSVAQKRLHLYFNLVEQSVDCQTLIRLAEINFKTDF